MIIDYVSLFCGIGGIELGLEKANKEEPDQKARSESVSGTQTVQSGGDFSGNSNSLNRRQSGSKDFSFRCVWANDNDRYASQIYRKHFGEKELFEGDIRDVDAGSIPDCQLLTGGFPCQTFSLAGKRKGISENRGTLFTHILRIASAKRPQFLLLENVKGLLSSDNGRTFTIILRSLDGLGYDVEWQVLNSKYFGVPQNRERVFIIGHSRERRSQKIFPIGESSGKPNEMAERGENSATVDASYYKGYDHKRQLISYSENDPLIIADRTRTYAGLGRNLESPKPMTNALSGMPKDNLLMNAVTQEVGNRQGMSFNQSVDKVRKTLGAIRRLTPVECERLQGFPDAWTEGVSDTQRYKLLGNAVTVNVIKFLGERLRECVLSGSTKT